MGPFFLPHLVMVVLRLMVVYAYRNLRAKARDFLLLDSVQTCPPSGLFGLRPSRRPVRGETPEPPQENLAAKAASLPGLSPQSLRGPGSGPAHPNCSPGKQCHGLTAPPLVKLGVFRQRTGGMGPGGPFHYHRLRPPYPHPQLV